MEPVPTVPRATATTSRRRGRRRFWLVVGVLLALFVLFEVGIRHVPPDSMTVTYNYSLGSYIHSGAPLHYTAYADQQTINDYYAAFNRTPVHLLLTRGIVNCALDEDASAVVFTWHGMPVESWTRVDCGEYIENAGGISDYYTLTYHESPDISMPPPSPNAG